MNITSLQGEKTVKSIAARLLAEPTKDTPKTTQTGAGGSARAARLNPQLNQIGDLGKGTPIVVPDGFALAPNASSEPMPALSVGLLG